MFTSLFIYSVNIYSKVKYEATTFNVKSTSKKKRIETKVVSFILYFI